MGFGSGILAPTSFRQSASIFCIRLARSGMFPDLGLLLSVGLSTAPEVADQINP